MLTNPGADSAVQSPHPASGTPDAAADSAADAAARAERPAFGAWQHSLQRRMLFVYFLVGLLPMFLAAELASQVVTHAFEQNLRTWLRETAIYFISSVADSQRETGEIGRVFAEESAVLSTLIHSGGELPPILKALISAEGLDLLAISDDTGHVVYSNVPILGQRTRTLGSKIRFIEVDTPEGSKLLVSDRVSFVDGGRQYQLILGSWLDASFFGNLSQITSFDFSLYGPATTASGTPVFQEIFRSGTHRERSSILPAEIVDSLKAPNGEYFDRHIDHDSTTGIYLPMFDSVGSLQGVIFCGLRTSLSATRWVSRTNVFLIIFVTGTLLSILIGYAVSRRLTRPLRSLASSVRAITAGDYRSRVVAEGNDEVAELAHAFNGMAARLEQLKELELDLRRQDRLSALGKAAAGIAHEVRNPLGIICTSTELIRSRYPLVERDQKLVENVISEVQRIDRLIGEFLAFAKPATVQLSVLVPADLVAHQLRVVGPELARRNIALDFDDRSAGAQIAGDADELHQAILNVILNACDAMAGGGMLSVHLRREREQLVISFRDTGCGVPATLGDRIFDPFVTTKDHGSGLGLAKVRSVLDGHRGRVEFHNLDNGAIFKFFIPLLGTQRPRS